MECGIRCGRGDDGVGCEWVWQRLQVTVWRDKERGWCCLTFRVDWGKYNKRGVSFVGGGLGFVTWAWGGGLRVLKRVGVGFEFVGLS